MVSSSLKSKIIPSVTRHRRLTVCSWGFGKAWLLWEEGEGGPGSFRSYEIIDNSTIPVNKQLKYGEYLEDMKDMLSEFFKTIDPAKSIICGY
nr:uncharacterized protein LOC109154777 isoform X3 [Ipomoea batatas]